MDASLATPFSPSPSGRGTGDEDCFQALDRLVEEIAYEHWQRVLFAQQQKRIGAAEFRNTQFSYVFGSDEVEKFVSTPELQSEGGIGGDPLEPGQVWTVCPGGIDDHAGRADRRR
jgi:ATP-dependent Lon protease